MKRQLVLYVAKLEIPEEHKTYFRIAANIDSLHPEWIEWNTFACKSVEDPTSKIGIIFEAAEKYGKYRVQFESDYSITANNPVDAKEKPFFDFTVPMNLAEIMYFRNLFYKMSVLKDGI